jgi:hypothetical protein
MVSSLDKVAFNFLIDSGSSSMMFSSGIFGLNCDAVSLWLLKRVLF